MGFNMLCITIRGEIYKRKVQEIKSLPFGPCDGIKISILGQIGGCLPHLDGFLFVGSCFYAIAFGLRLFDPTFPSSVIRDGGALKLDPRHSPNLTKSDLFVDGVCSPRFYGDWVPLNAEKVICNFIICFFVFHYFKRNYVLTLVIVYMCRTNLSDEDLG